MEENKKIFFKDHWFWGTIYQNSGIYFQVFSASVFINIFQLVSAFYIMTVYDRVIPNNAIDSLIALTIGVAIVLLFDFVLKMLRSYFTDLAGAELDRVVSDKIFKKIVSHDNAVLGSPAAVATSVREFEGVRDFFSSASLVAMIDTPFMILFLVIIASIGGWIAIVPILIVPLVIIVAASVQPLIKKYSTVTAGLQRNKMSTLLELLNNVEAVRTVAGGGFLEKRWKKTVDQSSIQSIKARTINNIATTFSQSSLQISSTGIVCVGVILVSNQSITTGALIACVILSGRTLSPLVQIGQLLTRLNNTLISYKNIDTLMTDVSRDEVTNDQKAVVLKSGNIQINDLDYSIEESKILNQINFSLIDGEKLGIVGSVGSGKTSLLKHIIGYILPNSGTIFVSDYDIKNIPSKALREHIGYCSQNIQLFSGSIYDNITAGLDNASEDDVVEAASIACAHDFIAKLPGGYGYQLVENGLNLSGGQRQSIALARAFIRKPKLLVLDEPTSSMDSETEEKIVKNIFSLPYNPTIIISTHRIQHLTNTDKIAILVNGKIMRIGPTKEILQQQKA
jgi:ATP-binding cassette subfamily C protein LapB|tara:strand:- start:9285 stop:10982 length:1698 start_codon:yes stop_codon:yes gene_type:complete